MGETSYSDRDSLARQEKAKQTQREEKAEYMKERQARLAPNADTKETGDKSD